MTGLGYVGLPLAVALSRHFKVIGFDSKTQRVEELKSGFDRTGEIDNYQLERSKIFFTSDPSNLEGANFHIVAVPTPIDKSKRPDLSSLLSASRTVGGQLKIGDTVVFESTVYPGVTEEECLPILEKTSGLKSGVDFNLGYSPERINPGDKEHTLSNVIKVVSGQTQEALQLISEVYEKIAHRGVYRAPSIKVAEAAKVIENAQRDLNVAFMNELAIIFNHLQINTQEVLAAAGTKWNFMPFTPGLVGGHCIGVDPYYLAYKAEQANYHPQVILSGRRINDQMGNFIAQQAILKMIHRGLSVKNSRVAILGITFKENCSDIRNSRVIDIINGLKAFGVHPIVHDPIANRQEVYEEYGIELFDWEAIPLVSSIIIAVSHEKYKNYSPEEYCKKIDKEIGVIIDVKSILKQESFSGSGVTVWRL